MSPRGFFLCHLGEDSGDVEGHIALPNHHHLKRGGRTEALARDRQAEWQLQRPARPLPNSNPGGGAMAGEGARRAPYEATRRATRRASAPALLRRGGSAFPRTSGQRPRAAATEGPRWAKSGWPLYHDTNARADRTPSEEHAIRAQGGAAKCGARQRRKGGEAAELREADPRLQREHVRGEKDGFPRTAWLGTLFPPL